MARIKIEDLPIGMEISREEMKRVLGGHYFSSRYRASSYSSRYTLPRIYSSFWAATPTTGVVTQTLEGGSSTQVITSTITITDT